MFMSKFLQIVNEATPSSIYTDKQQAVRYLTNVINTIAESAGEKDIKCTFDVFADAINITIHDKIFKLNLTQIGNINISDKMSEDDESANTNDPNAVTMQRIKNLAGTAEALTKSSGVDKRLFNDPVKRLAKVQGDLANRITDGISAEISKLKL